MQDSIKEALETLETYLRSKANKKLTKEELEEIQTIGKALSELESNYTFMVWLNTSPF